MDDLCAEYVSYLWSKLYNEYHWFLKDHPFILQRNNKKYEGTEYIISSKRRFLSVDKWLVVKDRDGKVDLTLYFNDGCRLVNLTNQFQDMQKKRGDEYILEVSSIIY